MVGKRSLASCLGGGDLDGYVHAFGGKKKHRFIGSFGSDEYQIITESTLLPTSHEDAADYRGVGTRELDRPGDSTVEDICDFVVEYINSDVLVCISPPLRSRHN